MAMWMVMGSANRCPQGRFAGPEGSTEAPTTALLRPAAARAVGTGSSGGAPQRRSEAARGQAGGSGGAHERHSPSAVKQDTPHTLPHVRALHLMRFHPVRGASAPSNHEVHGQRHHPQLLLLPVPRCHRWLWRSVLPTVSGGHE